MVGAEVTKQVLRALAEAHPASGDYAVRGVEIRRGWGDIVNVTIYADEDPHGHGRSLREAVEHSLAPRRLAVRLETSA